MGQMVMVMTPWDNPVSLTRAWCLVELYACRSSGSRFDVALLQRQLEQEMTEAATDGRQDAECRMMSSLGTLRVRPRFAAV